MTLLLEAVVYTLTSVCVPASLVNASSTRLFAAASLYFLCASRSGTYRQQQLRGSGLLHTPYNQPTNGLTILPTPRPPSLAIPATQPVSYTHTPPKPGTQLVPYTYAPPTPRTRPVPYIHTPYQHPGPNLCHTPATPTPRKRLVRYTYGLRFTSAIGQM